MIKNRLVIFLLLLLGVVISLRAQSHGLQVALTGGLQTAVTSGKKAPIWGDGGAEVDYTFRTYWNEHLRLGFRTGLGFDYAINKHNGLYDDSFTNYDYEGRRMDYHITAQVTSTRQEVRMDIPIMVHLWANGFILNIGPRLSLGLQDRYEQTIENPVIEAYYAKYGVTMVNRLVTGILPEDQQHREGQTSANRLGIKLAAEIGYEWVVNDGIYHTQQIGIQAYTAIGLWESGGGSEISTRLIDVSPIMSPTMPAPLVVAGLWGNNFGMHRLQAGLRLYWSIETIDVYHRPRNNRYRSNHYRSSYRGRSRGWQSRRHRW